VNYGTGQMIHREVDLSSDAFGIQWGHVRSYANILTGAGGNGSSMNGNRWYVRQLKVLKFVDAGTPPSQVIVEDGANSSQYFILDGGVYRSQFTGWNSLVWNEGAHEYTLTSANSGQQWVFHDQTESAGLRGQLKRVVDAAGRTVNCTYDGSDLLEKFEQVVDGQTSGFYYTWTAIASVESVTLKLQDKPVRRVRFTYYQSGDTGGNLDDLKSAIIEQYDVGTGSWRIVARKHYRYYLTGEPNGFASGLKLVIGATAYQQMLDAGLNPETATEAELFQFADFYYEYDAEKRVSLERLEGGRREYGFTYLVNGSNDGSPNLWLTKTVETLPDGSHNRVYTNAGYSVLVKILEEAATSRQWVDAYTYTELFRPATHAHPSAVASVTEPSGSGDALTVSLNAAEGLIEVTGYHDTTNPTTGTVAGYVSTLGVKRGSGGTLEVTEKLTYDTQTVGDVSLHPIREKFVYPVAGMADEDAPKTEYSRSWYEEGGNPTFQVQELETTQPLVSTDENGSGVAGVTQQVFDRFGRATWEMNQRGIVTYRSYVQSTGALLQRVDDANVDLLPDPPAGWAAYGQNLITDYVSDALGRITQERGPWHEVQLREEDTAPTAIRRVRFTAYDDENHETRQAVGYMTGSEPSVFFTLVGAVQVTRRDANGRVVDEIQAMRCCPTGVLTPDEALPQNKWSRWTHHIYDPWGRLFATRVYHTIPNSGPHSPLCGSDNVGEEGINYLETLYGYDHLGRRNRVVDATHTITRTVFDVRNLPVSQWTGTNDTGATDDDPTGGGTTGNNVVAVALLEYDEGDDGGDGNLTQQTLPVDEDSGNERVTTYAYDFRDRRDTTTQTDGTTTWITKTTYDNLDRVTASVRYHTAVNNANRISQSRAYYDALGRVYKTETDGCDPTDGDVVGTLAGQNWYDLVGNLIKQSQPGNTAFTKTVYDELDRPTVAYLCCRPGAAGVPSGDDNSVVDDTVIEQTNTEYDRAGNEIKTTQKKRFDDATGTGVLNGPHEEPKSRDSYEMTWPDAIGRPRASANYGTNGGSVPVRPAVAPARSDTILVTTNRYKDSGDANAVIDPMGIETRWENDQAGRRIRLIEGIAPGAGMPSSPSSSCNNAPYPPHPTPRITEFAWHPSGQLSKLILVNAETGNQVTRWFFGTTLADSAIASNHLVRTKIYPESDDRPAPAAAGPDGVYSRLEYRYNRQGQQTEFKDADGTTHAYTYNKTRGIVEDAVTELADGLNGEVRRIAYSYDNRGLTSKVSSHDAVSGGSIVNEVVMEYDAFMQLSADKQSHDGAVDGSTPEVGYAYETDGTKNSIRRVSTTYPTSTREVEAKYGTTNSMDDHLGRVSALQVTGESDDLVDYMYCGSAWQVRVGYPAPEVELTYRHLSGERPGDAGDPYTGYDRFDRTVDMPWVKTSDGSIVERSRYGFDRASRRLWQTRPLTDTQDQQYDYDALSQVSAAARGCLNAQGTVICGPPASAESWDYDPTGNWRGYHTAANGATTLDQYRVHDRGNRLTQIEDNPNNMILDRVGRMRQMAPDAEGDWDGKLEITWDAWSRITQVVSNSGSSGSYRYDGLHRRVTRAVSSVTWHSYYNDEWRPLEERKDSDTTPATSYLWGARHRDDLVRRDRATSGTSLDETRYVLMAYFNPAAITDEDGVVTERYAFSAFGVRTILNPDFTVRSGSECIFEFAFQGQFLDIESGFLNYGYRYYLPALGRWACKDPIQEDGGLNLYGIANDNPVNHVDFYGLAADVGCLICLYENHYRNQHFIFRGLKSLFKKNQKSDSPVCGYLGCGANKFNDAQQTSPGGGIPGMPRNHAVREELQPDKIKWAEKEGLELSDFQKVGDESDDLDAAIDAAKQKAEEMCVQNCCEAVDIVVKCGAAQAKAEKKQRGPNGNPVCGTTVTVPCK
jgi:RHS repeat-associated protein